MHRPNASARTSAHSQVKVFQGNGQVQLLALQRRETHVYCDHPTPARVKSRLARPTSLTSLHCLWADAKSGGASYYIFQLQLFRQGVLSESTYNLRTSVVGTVDSIDRL